MKKAFNFIQANAWAICIFFAVSAAMLQMLAKGGSFFWIVSFLVFVATTSTIIFGMCFWYLKAGWELNSPGKMAALAFGSVTGMLVSYSAFLVIFKIFKIEFHTFMVQASYMSTALMIFGVIYELVVKPAKES